MVLALLAGLLVSCGLPSKVPPTVTDPQVIALFNRAKAGHGESLYQIGQMYKYGTNGFPKNRSTAETFNSRAARAARPSPSACYEEYLYWKKANAKHPNATKSRLRDEYLAKAARYGDSRAIAIVEGYAASEEETAEREWRFNATHVRCAHCNGHGSLERETDKPIYETYKVYSGSYYLRDEIRIVGYKKEYVDCPHCENGYVDRY